MSNLPPNPFNNIPGAPQLNANPGPPMFNHNPQFNQVPASQLPPGYGMKPDANSNSPLHAPTSAPNNIIGQMQNVNNFNQSGSNSPAFNHQGMMPPPQMGLQSSPHRPPIKPTSVPSYQLPPHNVPLSSPSPGNMSNANPSPILNLPKLSTQQHQINDTAPPLIPSCQYNQPLMNGPPMSGPPVSIPTNQYLVSSSGINPPHMGIRPPTSVSNFGAGPLYPPYSQPQIINPPLPMTSQPNTPFSHPSTSSAVLSGPLVSSPPGLLTGPTMGSARPGVNGSNLGGPPTRPPLSGTMMGTSKTLISSPPFSSSSGPSVPPISNQPMGPPVSSPIPDQSYSGLHKNGPSGPPIKPVMSMNVNAYSGPQSLPIGLQNPSTGPSSLPPMGHQMGPPSGHLGPPSGLSGPLGPPSGLSGPLGPPSGLSGPLGPPSGMTVPPSGPSGIHSRQPVPPSLPPGPPIRPPGPITNPPGPPAGPMGGQPITSIQSRYPQMPQSNYNQQNMPQQPNTGKQYGYNAQGLGQQMGKLSVTQQGFDQLWGHQMIDLLQCRQILPDYPEDPPEIKLGHQFADSPNCSPEIFRCTINRIPETNSLLQKSRLPLGILIHPFKDLNHLPVIQCTTIVRCRACRTYINPFVYFVDAKRWKCNLCYRVNELPEEFQYDPVSKSYGDPSRRPEIKSATIEFIAPSEYMLRPPQPAVYLFLMDVSQLARDSGYLQVLCETLKSNLDQLPGDARTQVGFICYDSHVHYYLMSEGLTRPKEMTVLDIDEVFLPSPESLLVNLGERRELIKELLTVLPQRYSAPGTPASALGAALQAAYKLMAPTGGRITVFQTCLPNVGPGALQSREDPNARSSKEVAHLNPATDFYKRLALDCSGAQVAVDLFLITSQYSDLATLSGMSKFSGGTIYHIPLFRASRAWQADQMRRMLTRYLTRKIGFEAVMRVRCTRGISIHTFHGNFFVRSTDLLSLPNVSPDAGFGMQLTIEESLSDLQQVCFQAALLYTSSKGERRIRVHTLALPIASNLTDVLHSADQHCIIGLLSKMAVDRCVSASMSEAREAVMNVAVDAMSAHRLSQNLPAGAASASLHAPGSLRLLPLYLLALLKRKAFRTGTSTRLDDRVADMCDMKCLPLPQLLRAVYPDLYPVHSLREHAPHEDDNDDDNSPDPPRLHLSAERINSTGAYLLDDGDTMIIYICSGVSPAFLSDTFGVAAFTQLPDEARTLPRLESEGNQLLHSFIDKLNDDRPYASNILVLKDNSPSRQVFTERLVDDRVESAFSYYEFLQHVKSQVK